MDKNISVVLIAHNEEICIGRMIEGLLSVYDREILEIVVVDDASTDKTASRVEELMRENDEVKLIRKGPPCGAGRALKTGFKNIDPKATFVLTMDSDFVENIGEVRRLIEALETRGGDGVIGSRFVNGSRLVGYPLVKRLLNRSFHRIVRALFGIRQQDMTNNFKLYRREIFERIPWKSDGFAINAETGMLPILSSYRIEESPISWVARRPEMGKSKFRILKHGRDYFKVIAYAWRLRNSKKRIKQSE